MKRISCNDASRKGTTCNVSLPEDVLKFVNEVGVGEERIRADTLKLGFDNLSMDEVLRQIIPSSVTDELPSSFETVGHLAHFNLKEDIMPYRHLVGQVVIAKHRHIKTVVTKTGMIESEFRTFPMEIIAGENNTVVSVRQDGVRFQFDYRDVYWNSRLEREHASVAKIVSEKSRHAGVVCDMFCGIGPFAIPMAMKGCTVLANDLNPRSVHFLDHNAKLNKVSAKIRSYNMDGRAFVRRVVRDDGQSFDFVLMNLPAIAIEFLDVFRDGLCDDFPKMPRIFCYCFSNAPDRASRVDDVRRRVEKVLDMRLDVKTTRIRDVRDVAPNKHMVCAEFVLPRRRDTPSSSFSTKERDDDDDDSVRSASIAKKRKRK